MPGTPPTTPRFGAKRLTSTDAFDIAADHNAAVDALDLAAKFTSSLSTARPTSPVVDQYNWSTDTKVMERWNGTAWERPTPAPHASSHQDGGTDALTVREAMMATGTVGLAKGTFSAYRSTALTASLGAVILYNQEEFDVSSWYDPATGAFTPQIAGYYRLSVGVGVGSMAAGNFISARIFKNNVFLKQAYTQSNSVNQPVGAFVSHVFQANGTTDFFQGGYGASVSVAPVASQTDTFFGGELVGRS